jgi:hypothetical protein
MGSQIRRRTEADNLGTFDSGGDGEGTCRSISARFGPNESAGGFARHRVLEMLSPKLAREPFSNASSGWYWAHGGDAGATLALSKTDSRISPSRLIC